MYTITSEYFNFILLQYFNFSCVFWSGYSTKYLTTSNKRSLKTFFTHISNSQSFLKRFLPLKDVTTTVELPIQSRKEITGNILQSTHRQQFQYQENQFYNFEEIINGCVYFHALNYEATRFFSSLTESSRSGNAAKKK